LVCLLQACKEGTINNQQLPVKKSDLRKAVVSEILELQKAILTGNKEKVSGFFDFPITEGQLPTLSLSYDSINKISDRQVDVPLTKELFIRQESFIIPAQFRQLFSRVNINVLTSTDSLREEMRSKGDPCMFTNSVNISGDTVLFTFVMGVDDHYQLSNNDKGTEEGTEDLSSLCEHDNWWTFVMKNGRLKFVSYNGAD